MLKIIFIVLLITFIIMFTFIRITKKLFGGVITSFNDYNILKFVNYLNTNIPQEEITHDKALLYAKAYPHRNFPLDDEDKAKIIENFMTFITIGNKTVVDYGSLSVSEAVVILSLQEYMINPIEIVYDNTRTLMFNQDNPNFVCYPCKDKNNEENKYNLIADGKWNIYQIKNNIDNKRKLNSRYNTMVRLFGDNLLASTLGGSLMRNENIEGLYEYSDVVVGWYLLPLNINIYYYLNNFRKSGLDADHVHEDIMAD